MQVAERYGESNNLLHLPPAVLYELAALLNAETCSLILVQRIESSTCSTGQALAGLIEQEAGWNQCRPGAR